MTETSNSHFRITLGRGGQAVKKNSGLILDGCLSDAMPPRSKRSVLDRLGNNVGEGLGHESEPINKRFRGIIDTVRLNENGRNALGIGKDDLRRKIMQKNATNAQHDYKKNSIDLREKLSRELKPLKSSTDMLHHVPERKDISILGPSPLIRPDDYWSRVEPIRDACSPWTLEQLRRKSPDRVQINSRGLPPQINTDKLPKVDPLRSFDDARSVPYTAKDGSNIRPVSVAPYVSSSALPTGAVKPVAPVPGQVASRGLIIPQKSPYTVTEQLTVDGLLNSLGLGKYAIILKAEEVDMPALKQMGDDDLKEIGIPMGPRKKILSALMPRSNRQP